MGRTHKKCHKMTVGLALLLWPLLASGCNWLGQGTAKLGLVRSQTSANTPTVSTIRAGAIALGEGITSELSTNLIGAGLTPIEAQIVVDSSQTEIVAAAGQISIQTLSLVETNPLTYVAGPAVRGAIKALDEPGVNLADGDRRAAIAQVVMSSTVGSLGGRTEGMSTDQIMSLQKDMVGTGVKSLNDASLGGDQAANAIKALTTGAAESLSKSVDPSAAATAAASIVSGAVESLSAAGISTDLIQSVVGSAVEGVVAQLSKTGVQDTAEAASLVAKSSVQSLKVLALPVEKIIEATEGAAKGAVSALTAAGVSKDAIATAAQKVASSSAAALKTAGVPDESVGRAAGAIASGAIQGLGAAGLSASEIAASKSVSAIVSGASSGVAASGVATEKISSALGDVAGTAISSLAKLKSTTSGDITAIQSQVVSEVIQTTIAQAIASGAASGDNISAITATIATGAGQGLASLSRSGVTVSDAETVIKQATVTVLTEQQSKIGIDSSTIASVAASAGQTAEASKTAEVAKTSGTSLPNCLSTFPDTMSDADFKTKVMAMTTLPTCEREMTSSCPKKRSYPETNASWIAIANSNICQFSLQKVEEPSPVASAPPCPAKLEGPVSTIGLQEVLIQNQYQYRCQISQGLCPAPPFDAHQLSSPPSGAQTCSYVRKNEIANHILIYPPGGTFGGPLTVWISAPRGASVYVTMDGTTPTSANGTVYDGKPFTIQAHKTLKAFGTLSGVVIPVVSATFDFSEMGWEPPRCEDIFPNTTVLSEIMLKSHALSNDFLDVDCSVPALTDCPALENGASGYVRSHKRSTPSGREHCAYSRTLPACPQSVQANHDIPLISSPLTQTAFAQMSLPEKPFGFERACQYLGESIDDLRFSTVAPSLKSQGYFAEVSTDAVGRRRVAIYLRSRPCPGLPLSLDDLDHMNPIEFSGQKTCEVAESVACPEIGSDAIGQFMSSHQIYSNPNRKRCIFTPVVNTCPAAEVTTDDLTEVSGWQEDLFLCSLSGGSCPASVSTLSQISAPPNGSGNCVYARSEFYGVDKTVDANLDQSLSITASLQGGDFGTTGSVVLSSTPGATIRYTVDGSYPTSTSPIYSAPILITPSTRVRAIAFKDGKHSPHFSFEYSSTPLCTSLNLDTGYTLGQLAWNGMPQDPQQSSSTRSCRLGTGSQCPMLSSNLAGQDIKGPFSENSNNQLLCKYKEPVTCNQIFTTGSVPSSSVISDSPFKDDFGDVKCTQSTGLLCPQISDQGSAYDQMIGRELTNGTFYCHYIKRHTDCPIGIVNEQGMGLLSNPINASFLPSMDSLSPSEEFTHACRLGSPVSYPTVASDLAVGGIYAEFRQLPGTSRIVLRRQAPPCPSQAPGTSLNVDSLKHMSFVENRGFKACEVKPDEPCPTVAGGDAYSVSTTDRSTSNRCEYRLQNPASCPTAGSITTADLTLFDDIKNPLFICSQISQTHFMCPSGNADFTLISGPAGVDQRCIYQPTFRQSCRAIKDANPAAMDDFYTIDPDGPGPMTPMEVYCDMTTDGGGWTLIGRGREDWAWNNAGKNIDQVKLGIGTPSAFIPAYLPSATIDKLLGLGSLIHNLAQLLDGVRIRRAANNLGTVYQEVRWKYTNLPQWSWLFDAAGGLSLASITCEGSPCDGAKNTRDTLLDNNNNTHRIFTWAFSLHGDKRGFSYGMTVTNGTNSATDFLWENTNEEHAIPYTEVYIRR